VSGITLERPGLQQLVADCLAEKIARVVTQDPDRLSREPRQLAAHLKI
jgi:DNA invertase Pin-like site-specific DNA recombinase